MRKKKTKVLVVCSGGLDSCVALYDALHRYETVEAITFAYGQNHMKRENAAVREICKRVKVPLTKIDMSFIGKNFESALLGGVIPDSYYDAKSMKSTTVPYRNGIMLSVAAGLAQSRGCGRIVLGNHAGDHYIYPDCRPEFIKACDEAIRHGTGGKVRVESPFCNLTKADIVRVGARLGVPFELTYSCYKGGRFHCGKCGTCIERREAFMLAGVKDPTKYGDGK
jgi:7-cyano-7-deazaguanine synthase